MISLIQRHATFAFAALHAFCLVSAKGASEVAPAISSPSEHVETGGQGVLASVDSNNRSKWCGLHEGRPVVWMAKLPGPGEVVRAYSFTSGNDVPTRDPKDWILEGSKDGERWTLLDRKTDQSLFEKRLQSRSYELDNETAYTFYRFTFLKTHDATHFQFSEISLEGVSLAGAKLAVPPTLEEIRELGALHSIYRNPLTQAPAAAVPVANLKVFRDEIKGLLHGACIDCHGPEKQKGKFRIDTLNPDLIQGGDKDWWLEVMGVLSNGEMPPPDEETDLSDAGRTAVIDWLSGEIQRASQVARSAKGRSSFRRLTRYEYNYALQDLLGLPSPFARNLPPETASEDGFKNSSEMLQMSAMQFQTYREIGLKALKRATVIGERPEPVAYVISMQEAMEKAASNKKAKLFNTNDESYGKNRNQLHLFDRETGRAVHVRDGKSAPSPEAIVGQSPPESPVLLVLPKSNELKWNLDRFLPDEGVMRVSIRAWRSSTDPDEYASLRLGFSAHTSNNANFSNIISERDIPVTGTVDNPQLIHFDIPLGDIQRNPFRKLETKFPRRDEFIHIRNVSNARGGEEPLHVLIDYIEVSAPFYEQWPPKTHTDIFPESENKGDEENYGRDVLARFMGRAWRRPATTEEVDRFLELFVKYRPEFKTFEEAMLEVLATVLAHPEFLYLTQRVAEDETNGRVRISDQELASRLSVFLWSSIPDEELQHLAEQGKLRNPEILEAQVQRMLADPRAKRFTRHFVQQWLGLDGLDSVTHITDDSLMEAMQEEPLAFFDEVLEHNLSVMDFIHSDYVMVNERLAGHYGIRDVYGYQFRKVPIEPEMNRGGLLTGAAVLAMNSDGKDSHPLKRGVWMLERILHDPPPPPPPNVPEVDLADPEIQKMTLKERIADHRNDPACYSCHARIDPWGIAFENYDAMGSWRTRIGSKPVDADSELFNEQLLAGIGGLKEYLLKERQDQFARAMVYKMAAYALGRPLSFADHSDVEDLTSAFRENGDRLGDLVHLLTRSEIFNSN
ncbi:MAG: mono/diheme cytochrome c family protein [Verrucomicrobiales bacterium]|jgi:mono/diheme cytochrome c family protein